MKVKFGSLIVNGSGSIGGHVISTNRGGAFMRTKVTPVNPNTTYQASTKARFGNLTSSWRALTDAQRQTWADAVSSWQSTDIFGDKLNPSGMNLYVKLNRNLCSINYGHIMVAPPKQEMPNPGFDYSTIGISGGEIRLYLENLTADGQKVEIWATPIVSNGVTYVEKQYVLQGSQFIGSAQVTLDNNYNARMGQVDFGDKVFIKWRVVLNNGQTGQFRSSVAVIQA